MANMYDITGLHYYPSTNREWFAEAIFGGNLVESGNILPLEGVKESTDLNLFSLVGKMLQKDSRDCAWTPNQIAKLSNKTLQVITYKINLEQCIDELEAKNTIWMLKAGANNDSLPTDLENLTMSRISNETSNEVEELIIGGNSANADEFDGLVQTLLKSSDSIKIQGVALTIENILSEIQKLYLTIPKNVRAQGKKEGTLRIYTSYDDIELVKIALSSVYGSNVVINPNFTINGDVVKYLGVELVPVLGMPENTMVGANWDNLILGTDLISDFANIRLKNKEYPLDNIVAVKGRMRIGFSILFDNEAVIYSPEATASARLMLDTEADPETEEYVETEEDIEARIKELEAALQALQSKNTPVGYDGVSLIVDGIDQTPVHKLPKVGDLTATINASDGIGEIKKILETELNTLRHSDNIKNAGEARIKELEGGV